MGYLGVCDPEWNVEGKMGLVGGKEGRVEVGGGFVDVQLCA
jgi:hypothetical protein